jgi:hypothetical protein
MRQHDIEGYYAHFCHYMDEIAMRPMMDLSKEHNQENQICIVFSVVPASPKKPSSVSNVAN